MERKMLHKNVLQGIGNTPVIQIDNIYAKMEHLNPSGSIKDRVALRIIEAAERSGEIKPGYTIVEATSGNTGIALSMVGVVKGYKVKIVMPENMSLERRQMMKAFGAEIILTSEAGSLNEAIKKAEEIARQPKTFYAKQFENPNNVIAHEITTGPEIIRQVGHVDAIVAGVGTGGTLMGIANALKKVNPDLKVIAVEPTEAPVMLGGMSPKEYRSHKIQGIGDGFIPKIIDMKQVDEVITVTSEEAMDMSNKLARLQGLMVGISAGANIFASMKIKNRFKKIATLLPDRGERYLSMGLYDV
jgi:cysteine synthase